MARVVPTPHVYPLRISLPGRAHLRYLGAMEFHAVVAVEDRLSLCSSDRERTAAARAIARTGGAELLLFCVADDHAHTLIRGEPRRASQVAGNIAQALQRACRVRLQPTFVKPVESRSHLKSLVPYILDQTTHHGLTTAAHPATWPGSAFLDLVGARIGTTFGPEPLREALPRLTRDEVWAAVKLPHVDPADDTLLARAGFEALAEACCGALGLVDLRSRSYAGVRGRRALVRLAAHLGFPGVLDRLELPSRTARRHASSDADPVLEAAVRMWVAIHSAAGGPPAAR